jgi:hypothetical protein
MKRLTFAVAAVLVASCSSDDKASIQVFTAAPDSIQAGASTQLIFAGAGSLTIDQGVGDVTGKTSVTVTPAATTTYTLTAAKNGGSVTKTASVTVGPASIVAFLISQTSAGDPVAGAPATFDVTAVDSKGHTIAGYVGTAHFASDDGQATVPADTTFTLADAGKHSVSATFKTAGTHVLTATDTQVATAQGTGVVRVTPAPATACAVVGLPETAGASAQLGMRVVVKDGFGNVATGYTGTMGITSSDPAAQLGAPETFTASDSGAHAFSLLLRTAGNQMVTATDTATASLTCQAPVSVVAGATLLDVSFPGLTPPLDSWAGSSITARITAQDAAGNRISNYAGTVAFSASDGAAVVPANVTFAPADNGQKDVTVTFNSMGAQTLTATDTATPATVGTSKPAKVHGLVYTDPASGGKVRLVLDAAASNAKVVQLDLVSNTSLFPLTAGTADTVRNGAFAAGMNLPVDATKVVPDATLLVTTVPATTPASTAVLNLGTGPKAVGASLSTTAGALYSGVSQKRREAGSATIRGDVAVRPFPGASSFYYSLRLALAPNAPVGTVFDGQALGSKFHAAIRDRSGSDVFSNPDFAIGKLEVR